jgi:hypothetical protein
MTQLVFSIRPCQRGKSTGWNQTPHFAVDHSFVGQDSFAQPIGQFWQASRHTSTKYIQYKYLDPIHLSLTIYFRWRTDKSTPISSLAKSIFTRNKKRLLIDPRISYIALRLDMIERINTPISIEVLELHPVNLTANKASCASCTSRLCRDINKRAITLVLGLYSNEPNLVILSGEQRKSGVNPIYSSQIRNIGTNKNQCIYHCLLRWPRDRSRDSVFCLSSGDGNRGVDRHQERNCAARKIIHGQGLQKGQNLTDR